MEITALPLETQPSGEKPGGRKNPEDTGFSVLLAGIGQVSPDQAAQNPLQPLSGLAATTIPVQEAAADSGVIDALLTSLATATTTAQAAPGQTAGTTGPIGPTAEANLMRPDTAPEAPAAPSAEPLLDPAADTGVPPGGERHFHGVLPGTSEPGGPGNGSAPGATALAALQAVIGEGRSGPVKLPLRRQAEATSEGGSSAPTTDRTGAPGEAIAKPDAALASNRQIAERVLPGSELPDRAPPPSPTGGDSGSPAQARAGGFDSLLDSTQSRHPTAATRPADQLAVRIHHAVEAGQNRIQFRLHPAELGRIEVRLDFSDDGPVRAAIRVERSEALDLLQRDSRLLERALQDAGIKTDQSSLSFDLREQNHGRPQAQDAGDGHAAQNQGEEPALTNTERGGTGQDYLRDGLLDITV